MCVIQPMLRRPDRASPRVLPRGAPAPGIRAFPTSGLTRAAVLLLLTGVAVQPPGGTLHAQGSDSSRITRAEIAAHPRVSDALALIRQLRPRFLAGAGRPEPVVYIDTTRAFSIDDLSTVPAINVQEIRFLTAAEAAGRYGKDGPPRQGVILVTTRRQATPSRPRPPGADGTPGTHPITTHLDILGRTP